jgi:hypothetical protein
VDACRPIDFIIFEGWCADFQLLGPEEVEGRWRKAHGSEKALASCRLKDLIQLDQKLKEYCETFIG